MGVIILPNRDGTGPEGRGPKTGRGLGDCPPTSNVKRYKPRYLRRNRRG